MRASVSVYPHIGGMDVSILACIILCVFLLSRHILDTKLELFSVWLVCHVFSEFDSCKNFKTKQERERERNREEEEGQRGRRKRVKKNSRTYLLAPVVFTPNAWLPSLKASTRTWVVKICSHSLALACLTTLSCRTKLSAPSDIRPYASRLRMLFIAAAPTATVLRQVHHIPCNKDVLHPWLDSWLSTASQSRQFSSTAHIERRLRETDEWRRPPSL